MYIFLSCVASLELIANLFFERNEACAPQINDLTNLERMRLARIFNEQMASWGCRVVHVGGDSTLRVRVLTLCFYAPCSTNLSLDFIRYKTEPRQFNESLDYFLSWVVKLNNLQSKEMLYH